MVDHAALRRHIESGHLTGAAADVFPVEPKNPGEEFVSELRGLPNVILTPHVGGSTEEAQQDIGHFVTGKLRDYVAGGTTSLSVNVPSVALPRAGGSRLLHLHVNTPRRAGDGDLDPRRVRRKHRRPAARDRRLAGLRRDRRHRRGRAVGCAAGDAGDGA